MPPKTKAPAKTKPAASAKPARKAKAVLSETEQLKRLFRALCAQIDGGHLVNAVKTCDKILRISPSDPDVTQTKLFLLLQAERYTDALVLASDQDKYAFERAYTLYRLQKVDESRPILDALKDSTGAQERGVQHLEAQMAYRQGQYDTALEAYTQLLDTAEPNSEEHTDILTNLHATQAHVDFLTSGYLSSVDALPSSILSTLESVPPPSTAQPIASTSTTTAPAAPAAPKVPRARRIPKGIIPGTSPAPDPERWIKKRERSTFVQRKRRGGGGAGGATQGVALEVLPGQVTAPAAATSASSKKKGKKK